MLQPVRTRWRKAHKGRIHGTATRASSINYGAFALKALQPERITGKQIEAARVALTRHMKRQGRVWTRVFPNIPVSKKPIGFFDTGMFGNTLVHTLPCLFICLVNATLAASICFPVILSGCKAFKANAP